MLTRPAVFQSNQFSTAADRHVIVKVVSGASTWLFSDVDMQLTDGHVYPLMGKGQISITQSVDIFTRKWRLSDITINLNNADYLGQGATLSDEWGSILNATVTVYLAAGGMVTALSDCLIRFIGIVVTAPKYDSKTLTLKVVDKSKTNIVELPQNLVGETSGLEGAGVETVDKKVPLVYGDFVKTFDATSDTGLAVAELYGWESQHPKVVASDHALKAITKLFARVSQLPEPLQYLSVTLTADDSELGTALPLDQTALVYLYPISNFVGDISENATDVDRINNITGTITSTSSQDGGFTVRCQAASGLGLAVWENVTIAETINYNGTHVVTAVDSLLGWFEITALYLGDQSGTYASDAAINTTNVLLASNQDDSDYATIKERTDDIFTLLAQGLFSFDNYATGNMLENDLGQITEMTQEIKVSKPAGVTYDGNGLRFSIVNGPDTNHRTSPIDILTLDGTTFNAVTIPFGQYIAVWHWLSGMESRQATDKNYPLVFLLYAGTTISNPTADNIPGNQAVIRVHEFRIKVEFELVVKPKTYFVECEGREYDSWITGRSSNYSAGDMIEDPAGIIESILRDEVGLATADIDEASFIAAENTAIKARINFHDDNQMDSNKAIRQITEQSTFLFFFSAAGKAKLIDLKDTTPTTATRGSHPVVIPFSHIKKDSLKVSKEPKIYNDLTYKSRWQEEYRKFRDSTNTTDSTSITNFGIREYLAKWKNLAGTAASAIASFLIGVTGIWSNQHNVINLEAMGYTGADIEIGDWIELSSDIDPHLKCFGVSWSGKQFLVITLTQPEDSTKIKAIELYG